MKINVVVALAAAVCVLAAPANKQIECKPHEGVKWAPGAVTASTNGFLTIAQFHRRHENTSNVPLFGHPGGTLQPSDGKLKVSTQGTEKLDKDGKRFQLMSCKVNGKEYHDKEHKLGQGYKHMILRGQLKTGDECLALKDGEVKMEKCATTEEELKPQIIEMSQFSLVKMHGNNVSTLIVDVKDGVLTNVREMTSENVREMTNETEPFYIETNGGAEKRHI